MLNKSTHSMNVPIVIRWIRPINGLVVAAAIAANPPVKTIITQARIEIVPNFLFSDSGCFLNQIPISSVDKIVPKDRKPARTRCMVPIIVGDAPRGSIGKNRLVESPNNPMIIMHQLLIFPEICEYGLLFIYSRTPKPKPISKIL